MEEFYHVLQRQPHSNGDQNKSKKRIDSKDYLPLNKTEANHAEKIGGLGATVEDIARIKREVQAYKSDLKEYAAIQIQKIIQQQARKEGLLVKKGDVGTLAMTFQDVGESWKNDGSYENAEKLFKCTYQVFDNDPGLLKGIAEEWMEENGLVYDKPLEPRQKGCVGKIVEDQKRTALRSIMNKSNKTYQRRLNISWKVFPERERYLKRKRGVWDRRYVVLTEGDSGEDCTGLFNATNTSPQSTTESDSSKPTNVPSSAALKLVVSALTPNSAELKVKAKTNLELQKSYDKLVENSEKTKKEIDNRLVLPLLLRLSKYRRLLIARTRKPRRHLPRRRRGNKQLLS